MILPFKVGVQYHAHSERHRAERFLPMKPISVVPPWPQRHQKNALFDLAGFREWKSLAAARGFDLQTHDLCPPNQAAALWCVDLSESVLPLWAIRNARRAGACLVLQILESPVVRPRSWVKALHGFFDRVLTYDSLHSRGDPYRHYRIPQDLEVSVPGPDFAERRIAVMLNTNLSLDVPELRRARLNLGRKKRFRDTLETLNSEWHARRAELYSWRRTLARAAERYPEPILDLYGQGWDGTGLLRQGKPTHDRPYRCATDAPLRAPKGLGPGMEWAREKRALISCYRFTIATENYRGDRAYVSEKIIDPLLAGCVPVYLGDERITSIVPESAFVDGRRFRSLPRLLAYLEKCPAAEWEEMRAAGASWIQSGGALPFSGASFAAAATDILEELLP